MNKARMGRFLALVLTLAIMLSTVPATVSAASCDCKSIAKLTVKAKGMLYEGQKITKSTVKKALKATAIYESGKKKSNYTSYKVKEVGKTVKANSKDKCKLTLTAGTVKKTVSIKVNRIKKIYIMYSKQSELKEGSKFSVSSFKKDAVVMAKYKKGGYKVLSNYEVIAAKEVTADKNGKFVVTVKAGKKKAKISFTVIPNTIQNGQPTAAPTQKPTATPEPTAVPTQEPTATPEPTAVPTQEPTATPEPTAIPTQEPTATPEPTAIPTQEPTATPEPTAVPTQEPTATPEPTVKVNISRNGEGKVSFNN